MRPRTSPWTLLLLGACLQAGGNGAQEAGTGPSSRPASRPASAPSRPSGPRIPGVRGFSGLLSEVVRNGRVDYEALAKKRAVLDAYLEGVGRADLRGADRAAKLAFYINAYNAGCLRLVLDLVLGKGPRGRDLKSVLAVGGVGFFKRRVIRVAGRTSSLDEIEREGRRLGDPRIHFAVNCASISCPPLRPRAYEPATLEKDLEAAARAYLRSPHGHRVIRGRLWVSSIFRWYEKDFGGRAGVAAFLRKRLPAEARDLLGKGIRFLDYDWSLNSR